MVLLCSFSHKEILTEVFTAVSRISIHLKCSNKSIPRSED